MNEKTKPEIIALDEIDFDELEQSQAHLDKKEREDIAEYLPKGTRMLEASIPQVIMRKVAAYLQSRATEIQLPGKEHLGPCLESASCLNHGNYPVSSWANSTMREDRLIVLAYENPEWVAKHACDNPKCINEKHLSAGSQTENMRDKAQREIQEAGLSLAAPTEIVIAGRLLTKTPMELSEEYGISEEDVLKIINRKKWASLTQAAAGITNGYKGGRDHSRDFDYLIARSLYDNGLFNSNKSSIARFMVNHKRGESENTLRHRIEPLPQGPQTRLYTHSHVLECLSSLFDLLKASGKLDLHTLCEVDDE